MKNFMMVLLRFMADFIVYAVTLPLRIVYLLVTFIIFVIMFRRDYDGLLECVIETVYTMKTAFIEVLTLEWLWIKYGKKGIEEVING